MKLLVAQMILDTQFLFQLPIVAEISLLKVGSLPDFWCCIQIFESKTDPKNTHKSQFSSNHIHIQLFVYEQDYLRTKTCGALFRYARCISIQLAVYRVWTCGNETTRCVDNPRYPVFVPTPNSRGDILAQSWILAVFLVLYIDFWIQN